MGWGIAILVVLVALAPLAWVLPSRSEKAVMALRTAAMRAGYQTRLEFVPKLNAAAEDLVSAGGEVRTPSVQCAAYRSRLSVSSSVSGLLPQWRWYRFAAAPETLPRFGNYVATEVPQWVVDASGARAGSMPDPIVELLRNAVAKLPTGSVYLACEGGEVVVGWHERGGDAALQSVLAVLQELTEGVEQHAKSLQEALDESLPADPVDTGENE